MLAVFPSTLLAQAIEPQTSSQPATHSIWTQEDMDAPGTLRLSDLLRTLGPLRSWGTDRFGLHFPGTGMEGAHGQGPGIEVDGHVMSFSYLDRQWVDRIPVAPSDIEKIELKNGLQIQSAGRASLDIVSITTKRPSGFTVRGDVSLINETGDPGPAVYKNPSLKNVDRSGPTAVVRMSWGNPKWFVQAGFDTDAYHLTDENIRGRVWRVYRGKRKPLATSMTSSVRVRYAAPGASVDIWGGRTLADNFVLDELAGWEWPVQEEWNWFVGSFSRSISGHITIGASGDYRSLRTNNFLAEIDLPNSLLVQEAHGEMYAKAAWSGDQGGQHHILAAAGGRVSPLQQRKRIDTSPSGLSTFRMKAVSTWMRTLATIEGSIASPVDRGYSPPDWSWNAQAGLSRRRSGGGMATLSIGLKSNLPTSVWQTEDWIRNGVQFDQWAGPFTFPDLTVRRNQVDATIGFRSQLSASWTSVIDFKASQFSGLTLPDREFGFVEGANTFHPTSNYQIGRSGKTFSPGIALTYGPSDLTRFSILYSYLRVIADGDLLFWKQFSGLSPHRIATTFRHSPWERFVVSASV